MSRIIKQRIVCTVQVDIAIDEEKAQRDMNFSIEDAEKDVRDGLLASDLKKAIEERFPHTDAWDGNTIIGNVSVNQTYGDCWAVDKEEAE